MRPRGLEWRETWKPECVHHPVGASWCCHHFSVPAHSPSRSKCLRTGPNIFYTCWVFLCLRRELQHILMTGCVTQVSSASAEPYLGLQAKKVLTLSTKRGQRQRWAWAATWTQFFTAANVNHLNLWPMAMKYFCWVSILNHCLLPLALGKVDVSLLQILYPNLCIPDT